MTLGRVAAKIGISPVFFIIPTFRTYNLNSSAKRRTTTAGFGCIGVIERESAPIQAIGEIQFNAHEVEEAFFVNKDIDIAHRHGARR